MRGIKLIELRQLKYFMTVCQELHFTKAAEKLNISQPSLSQQISNLETYVGMPLFDRIGRNIALTEAGKILRKHSQNIFHELEQAEMAIKDLNGLRRGQLKIGSLLTCMNYLFPPVMLKFKRLYPDVKLSILGMRAEKIKQSLLENKLDLGVTFLPEKNEQLEAIPLATEELSLALPTGHPLMHMETVDLETIGEIATVLLPKSYFLRELIEAYCLQVGIKLQPAIEMTTLESLMIMVEKGTGATILPKSYLDFVANENIVVRPLTNPIPKREIGFVYRKDKFMCAATKVFIQETEEISHSVHKMKQEA